ncbi:hypothetical protein HG537_0E05910 [Torulaspora globosa]|uniref:2-dehydropantoate 2-reductase n=1 Tax=Torulaspora globosa TaxID=48254 RepID=A0A7H9HXK0_9SACH|nr:hypothetical protein HG537_0E05910 [Torulaspora sp. CBS 2947]
MTGHKVLLIGAGGVGTIVAYGIHLAGNSELSIVVRRDFAKVNDVGYNIDSIDYGIVEGWKPENIYPSVAAAASSGTVYQYVIITTKNLPDIAKVEELAEPVITPGVTVVVLIQNGFDLCRPFFDKYPKNVVISGITYVGSHNSGGSVHQTQPDRSFFGSGRNPYIPEDLQESKVKEFLSIYSNGRNKPVYITNEREYRYKKLIYNAAMNTSCALAGVDTGRLELSGALDAVAIPAMREIIAIAKADGINLPNDCINNAIHGDDGDWFEPSMLIDVKKGNPIELEVILGNVLRVAEELNVKTPCLSLLYGLLKAVQFRLRENQGHFTLPIDRPISERFYK